MIFNFRFTFIKFQKAAVVIVAFFLCFTPFYSWGLNLESVEEFILKGDRAGALKELDRQKTKSNQEQLTKHRNKVSKMFFFDKSQRIYERAQSYLISDPKLAYELTQEALIKEPSNSQLLLTELRSLLLQKKCEMAREASQKEQWLQITEPSYFLLLMSIHLCLGDLQELEEAVKSGQANGKGNPSYLLDMYKIEIMDLKKQKIEPSHLLNIMNQESDVLNYPPFMYWAWRTKLKEKIGLSSYRQNFITVCKKPSSAIIKKYFDNPLVCHRLEEIIKASSDDLKEAGDV